MAYDELLTARMRGVLSLQKGLEEKKMFGGVGFLIHGNLVCGVNKNNLIVRVGPAYHAQALNRPHTRPFDITGRPMAGWVMVEPEGCATEKALADWIQLGVAFANSLPEKEK